MFESREAEEAFNLLIREGILALISGIIAGCIGFSLGLKAYWVILGFKFYWAAFPIGLVTAVIVFVYNFIRDTDKLGSTKAIVSETNKPKEELK